MSKRIQITLTDKEYADLQELSELRGESMSLIAATQLSIRLAGIPGELHRLRKLREQEERTAAELEKIQRRIRGEHQKPLDL